MTRTASEPPAKPAADLTRETPAHPATARGRTAISGIRRFIADYFWFVLKNVVGWLFILGSLPVGLTLPGPGGIPLFLIGFALVTFPGKRRLTTRVMRGVPMHVEPVYFTFLTTLISVLVTAGALWFAKAKYEALLETVHLKITPVELLGVCGIAAGVTWIVMRLGLALLNFVLRKLPVLRRKMRPWLRRKGIHLLPPRRRIERKGDIATDRPVDEIVEFDEKYSRGLRGMWGFLKTWFKRLFGVTVTLVIFARILGPITARWNDPSIQARLEKLNIWAFFASSAMFAIFLFGFRALAWRRILAKLGHTLPVWAATRIWSTSELARYLPVPVFQVIGRIYLIKPYGVRGSVTSVSQILELAIFLLANVLLAVSCLLYFGVKNLHHEARTWMIVAMALMPVLLILLHPRITYAIINPIMKRLGKPPIAQPLSGRQMLAVLGWNLIGLVWQSVAVFILTKGVLGLDKPQWWWVVAGAYSLAWVAGFLAVWAPAGIGVRELVFVVALNVVLPQSVREQIGDPVQREVVFGYLSLILRLWSIVGELMLALVAYALDFKGALGDPEAPGRVRAIPTPD